MIQKLKNILKNDFKGYSMYDKLFMLTCVIIQCIIFALTDDKYALLGLIAGIFGCISVIMFAKGKFTAYIVGYVQTISYLILSFIVWFPGEVIINVFYFVTMVWGMIAWYKHYDKKDQNNDTVIDAKKMKLKGWLTTILATAASIWLWNLMLTGLSGNQPFMDSCTTVFGFIGQMLLVWRFREQWIFWILQDIFSIKMWGIRGDYSMVAMYIAWTINCIYGWYNWTKICKYTNTQNIKN